MVRRSSIALLCLVVAAAWFGCRGSEQNRRQDEPSVRGESDEADESADDDAYLRLGRMYEEYSRACRRTEGEKTGALCRQGMAAQMGRQMMHMHRHYSGWGQRPPRGRMPLHGPRHGPTHRGRRGGRQGPSDAEESRAGEPAWRPSAMDLWHRQMGEWHDKMARRLEERGAADLAERHRALTEQHRRMAEAFQGAQTDQLEEAPAEEGAERERAGRRLYVAACAACHGGDGTGVSEAFPPLAESSIVAGDAEPLIRIVTFGMRGPVEVDGEVYDGLMPPFAERLTDAQIAAILTWVRQTWSTDASPVSPADVEAVRTDPPADSPIPSNKLGVAP